jgi:hypothetical protein
MAGITFIVVPLFMQIGISSAFIGSFFKVPIPLQSNLFVF